MNNPKPSRQKILSSYALAQKLKKRGKRKVVFANGCFDILHPGHLALLEKAKSLGDILVVGLNADQSVKVLKGKRRPILPERERAKILSALSCVDYVTIFGDKTPARLIQSLRPDILVKGADYRSSEIVGSNLVKKVVRIPLVKKFSTSRLIQKILQNYSGKR